MEELRAALTPRGETRRNPVLVTEQPSMPSEISQLRDARQAGAPTRRSSTQNST